MYQKNIFFSIIVLSFFLFLSNEIVGQNDFDYKLSSIKNIDINEQKADNLLNKKSNDTIALIKKAFILSRTFFKKNDLSLAIKYSKLQNKLSKKLDTFHKHYHTSYYLIGKYYMLNNQIDSALSNFKETLKLSYYPKKVGQALCHTGLCYRNKGNLYKSIHYYTKGLKLLKQEGFYKLVTIYSIDLSRTCNQIKTKESALLGISYLKMADSLIHSNSNLNISSNLIKNLKIALGNLYSIDNNNFKLAKRSYLKTIKNKEDKKNKYLISLSYLNLGELYLKQNLDSAFYYLNQSLINVKEINHRDKPNIISEDYRNLAKYYILKKQLNLALKSINKSIRSSFRLPVLNKDLQIQEIHFIKATARRNIIIALKEKIDILNLLYKQSNDRKYLTKVIETVAISDELVKYILQDSTESETQFLWRKDVSNIYGAGITAAHRLKNYELMFHYLERNKAYLLTQGIKDNNNKLTLPNHITSKDAFYKQRILNLEDKTTTNQQLKDSLFTLKLRYQEFNDSIKKIYPDYFSDKNNIQPISLLKAKNILNNKEVILSYFLDNNTENQHKLLGLFTSKGSNYSFQLDIDIQFYNTLKTYKKLITKPLNSKAEFKQFSDISNQLYNYLFPSLEAKELVKNKQLVIITNNILQNLPFEALNTKKDSLKYLIESNDISYTYSMSFLDFNKSLQRKTTANISGFAPIEFSNETLPSLEASKSEIDAIQQEINGEYFLNKNATKNSFLSNSLNTKILHLATHAKSANKPEIYFVNDTLKLHELYTHKTNADLVVLSACETNLGEIKNGEGVLSLARGFFYAGANSVISSLWNVNDASSTYLMRNFYKNLNNHESKVAALNNAKRKYLKEHSLSERSPYYWASFILIGDTTPTFQKTPYLTYFLIIICFFTLLLFLSKKGILIFKKN